MILIIATSKAPGSIRTLVRILGSTKLTNFAPLFGTGLILTAWDRRRDTKFAATRQITTIGTRVGRPRNVRATAVRASIVKETRKGSQCVIATSGDAFLERTSTRCSYFRHALQLNGKCNVRLGILSAVATAVGNHYNNHCKSSSESDKICFPSRRAARVRADDRPFFVALFQMLIRTSCHDRYTVVVLYVMIIE
jgi:hypothetical protein